MKITNAASRRAHAWPRRAWLKRWRQVYRRRSRIARAFGCRVIDLPHMHGGFGKAVLRCPSQRRLTSGKTREMRRLSGRRVRSIAVEQE